MSYRAPKGDPRTQKMLPEPNCHARYEIVELQLDLVPLGLGSLLLESDH